MIPFLVFLTCFLMGYGQKDVKITIIDFVQVLNDNGSEAMFYYQNNWKVLREMALEKEYIHSYQLLKVSPSEDAPFNIMLITTYKNEEQYSLREDHFTSLIKERGPLKLLNSKPPKEFRKTLFTKEKVSHL